MIEVTECILLCEFSNKKQGEIVQDILSRYNLKTPEGIIAALRNAAWQGFCEGLEQTKGK